MKFYAMEALKKAIREAKNSGDRDRIVRLHRHERKLKANGGKPQKRVKRDRRRNELAKESRRRNRAA